MTYYVQYWMEDEEHTVTTEELASIQARAEEEYRYLALTEITTTEMHFTIFDIEE